MSKEGENEFIQECFCNEHREFGVRNNYIDSELKVCVERIKILEFSLSYVPIRLAAGGDDEEDAKEIEINACYNERDVEWLTEHLHRLQLMNSSILMSSKALNVRIVSSFKLRPWLL